MWILWNIRHTIFSGMVLKTKTRKEKGEKYRFEFLKNKAEVIKESMDGQ